MRSLLGQFGLPLLVHMVLIGLQTIIDKGVQKSFVRCDFGITAEVANFGSLGLLATPRPPQQQVGGHLLFLPSFPFVRPRGASLGGCGGAWGQACVGPVSLQPVAARLWSRHLTSTYRSNCRGLALC